MASQESNMSEGRDATPVKTTPKDALVMASILKEMGVSEYEPRIINQMVEFAYRYITDTVEDARIYSLHSNRKTISIDDVKLAVSQRLDHSFTSPPPREFLLEIARKKNSQPLPVISDRSGLRLPPDRYCLTSNNYKIKGPGKKSASNPSRKPTSLSTQGMTSKSGAKLSAQQQLHHQQQQQQQQLQNPRLATSAFAQQQFAGSPKPQSPLVTPPMSTGLVDPNLMSGMTNQVGNHARDFPALLKRKRENDDDYDT